ncbi:hypothetical protein Q4560_16835 [Celeribacter halophilus]|uniref:hypothetical protein n=1 Tax=Celeribacter halophilus TaxID=576117 RepID=UPI0026E2FEA1|nr:hypothetical protein [Celeribacter halophilus]MDO6724935.1 hypothetical protein [Celeribacter halophilus]
MNELFLSGRQAPAYFSADRFTVWRQIQTEPLRLSQKQNPDALAGAVGIKSYLSLVYPLLPKRAISTTSIRGCAA